MVVYWRTKVYRILPGSILPGFVLADSVLPRFVMASSVWASSGRQPHRMQSCTANPTRAETAATTSDCPIPAKRTPCRKPGKNECRRERDNPKNPWHDPPDPATVSPLATGSPFVCRSQDVRIVVASPSRPVAWETSPPHAAMPPHRVRPPIACRRLRNGSHACGIHSHSAYAPSVKRWHLNIRAFSLLR